MSRAVYPGTFDPITNGHLDLIKRASALFDEVLIAVAVGHHKQSFFSFEHRLSLVQHVISPLPNVKALPLNGLLVDFAAQNDAKVVIRGLRTATDFDYEFQLAGMNRHLNPRIETIFMRPSQDTAFISGTLVRELIALKADFKSFVPAEVFQFIQAQAR